MVLWPAVKAEIMQATSLLWFARSKLDGGYVNKVDIGDSSTTGYALLTRGLPQTKIQEIAAVKGKWRFVPLPEVCKSAIDFLFFSTHTAAMSHMKLRGMCRLLSELV